MSLLNDAPSWFQAFSDVDTYSEETVGVAAISVVLESTTRVVHYYNASTALCYFRLDSTVVTASNGFPLPAGQWITLHVKSGLTLQLISASAAQDVRLLQVAA